MEKNKKRLIVFMPSMEGGGVEKNIILITNYLSKHIKKISLITYDKKFKSKFDSYKWLFPRMIERIPNQASSAPMVMSGLDCFIRWNQFLNRPKPIKLVVLISEEPRARKGFLASKGIASRKRFWTSRMRILLAFPRGPSFSSAFKSVYWSSWNSRT